MVASHLNSILTTVQYRAEKMIIINHLKNRDGIKARSDAWMFKYSYYIHVDIDKQLLG